ncbi:hypothetical protein LTR48_005621 [Friedmanniomyces endolithicus]|uniref:NAD(P)-binding protein n=1 Tax=Rachicladosporium monterosium TaxID=1507873 RepID=A0ABR0L3N8_9PEZI|nr:hypothetical protein LTR48_005621 [Friedmanniomyces endolithicus]KAK5142106.1 hypothetical protein LTR32_005486 [Rachicladosporium monterosium]
MAEQPDFIRSLPPWAGTTFVSKLNHDIPTSLDPAKQSLPSPFVVVVTGSSRGIGRATAKSFAQAGATGLILTARTVEALQETMDSCKAVAKSSDLKITTLAADNAVESSALAVADAIKTEHNGRLDLLVNNAGILNVDETAFGNIIDMDPSNFEQTISVNYVGRFYMINVVSQISGPLGFSISALATNRLSQRVAEAYADQGVVCYAVHPGAVKPEVPPPGMPPHFEEMAKESVGLCGSFLVWLVKEKREWLSGRYLDATWDVEELEKKREEIVEGDKLKMRLVV